MKINKFLYGIVFCLLLFRSLSGDAQNARIYYNGSIRATGSTIVVCRGITNIFIDSSLLSIGRTWRFQGGSPSTSSASPVTVVFNTAGTDSVFLRALGGIPDSTYILVQVVDIPDSQVDTAGNANFDMSKGIFINCFATRTNPDFTLSLVNSSTTAASNTAYTIHWGDGVVDSFTNSFVGASHLYTSLGFFTINIITYNSGCSSTRSYNFFNGNTPQGSLLTIPNTSDCNPATLTWPVDTANTNQNPPGTTYEFIVNDGTGAQTYTQANLPSSISHTFASTSCGVAGGSNAFTVAFNVTNPCATNPTSPGIVRISEKPVANFGISPDTIVCQGSVVTFNNTSIGNYLIGSNCQNIFNKYWTITSSAGWVVTAGSLIPGGPPFANGSNTLSVRFDSSGTYTIKLVILRPGGAIPSRCTADSITRTICVRPVPLPSFTYTASPVNRCAPATLTFTNTSNAASNCSSPIYVWSFPSGAGPVFTSGTNANSLSPVILFNAPGSYVVRLSITNLCGTIIKDSIIVIKGPPVVSLQPDKAYCDSQTLAFNNTNGNHNPSFNANGGTLSYHWTITPAGATFVSGTNDTLANPVIHFPANATASVTYAVIASATNECGSRSDTQQITINPPLSPPVVRDTSRCGPGSITLTASVGTNGTGLRWYDDSLSVVILSSSLSYTPTVSSTRKYYVSSFNTITTCESKRVPLTVTINAVPNSPAMRDTSRCGPSSVVLTGIPGTNGNKLNWYTSASGGSPFFSGNSYTTPLLNNTTSYFVSSFDSVTNCESLGRQMVTITINPLPVVFAGNDTSFCNLNNNITLVNYSPPLSGSGGTGVWSGSIVTASGIFNPMTAGVGLHTLFYAFTNTLTGCINRDTLLVNVINAALSNAGNDTAVCRSSGNVVLAGTPVGGTWTTGGNVIAGGIFNPTTTGIYTLVYTIGSGSCLSRDTVLLTVNELPNPDFALTGSVCPNQAISLAATNTNGTTASLYRWKVRNSKTFSNTIIPDSTIQNPSLHFPENKTADTVSYFIRLIIQTNNGCIDSVTKSIILNKRPAADFTLTGTSCGPAILNVINSTSNNPTSWNWSITPAGATLNNGASQIPDISLPVNTSNDSINYSVRLIATLIGIGATCSDTTSRPYTIYPKPAVAFLPSTDTGCTTLAVSFSNTSNARNHELRSTMGFAWSINGNNASTDSVLPPQLFINTLQRDSVVSVRLIGTTQHGCKDTANKNITIYPAPKSEFTASLASSCAPFVINSSIISLILYPQANDAYFWRILSGNRSSVLNTSSGIAVPSYTILNPTDSVIYQLITTNSHGCTPDTMEIMFRTIANPVVAFSMSDSLGCSVLNVIFTNLSSPGVALDWRFSNGQTSTSQTPSVSFSNTSNTADAVYFAKLVVTAGGTGCRDSITDTIRVFPKPKSIFGISQANLCPLSTIALTNSSVSKNASAIFRWQILNSDTVKVSDSTVATPNVIIPDNQSNTDSTFSIQLRSISVDGCIHDTVGTFTRLRRPKVQFTIPSDACGPITFIPVNTTSNLPAVELDWLWAVTPNISVAIVSANSQSPSITLPVNTTADSLIYTVKLTATRTAFGCIDTLSQRITLYPKPDVEFTSSKDTGCTPLNVSFINTTDARNQESRNTMDFVWTINGGNASTDSVLLPQVFTNGLQEDSIIAIRLIGTTQHGCKDTSDKNITIYPEPRAEFTASLTTSCAPFVIDNSIISLIAYPQANDTYTWRILTGNRSSVLTTTVGTAIPVHTITTPTDSVIYQLITTNIHGCKADTMEIMFRTNPGVVVAFSMSDSTGCSPLNVTFTNQSSPGVTLDWRFSNGQTSTSQTPSVSFVNASNTLDAIYFAKLIITAGSTGCRDSITDTIRVFPKPKSVFGISQPNLCPVSTIALINTSVFKNPSATFRWSILNSDTVKLSDSTIAAPDVVIPDNQSNADSIFSIRLHTISVDGCIHDTVGNFTRLRRPLAQFTIPSDACGPFTFIPLNTTVNISSAELSWLWAVAPNTSVAIVSTNSQSPFITIPVNTTADSLIYIVKLTATRTAFGCIDTLSQSITIYPKPDVEFASSIDTGCTPLSVSFTNITDPRNNELRSSMSFVWALNNITVSSDSVLSPQVFVNPLQHDSVLGIRLIGTTQHGCKDTTDKNITVYPEPKSEFTASPTVSCAPFNITSSSISLTQFPQSNDAYTWRILSGNRSSVLFSSSGITPPAYTIPTSGDSIVYQLITTNIHGCKADTMEIMFRSIGNPLVAFSMSDSIGCSVLNVVFTNQSSPGVTLDWRFSNGQTSTSQTPSVSFSNPSNTLDALYFAKLVVTAGGTGCRDSITDTIRLFPKPKSIFGISQANLCPLSTVALTNSSVSKNASAIFRWKILNSDTVKVSDSTVATPNVIIPDNQSNTDSTFSIRLRSISVDGCIHDTVGTFTRLRRPKVQFTIPSDACGPVTFIPVNTTSNLPAVELDWLWAVTPNIFVAIVSANSQSPSITLPVNTTADSLIYNVKLTATRTAFGCIDTLSQRITLYPKPDVEFTSSKDTGCTPLSVSFANTTDPRNNEPRSSMSFVWDINNSNVSADSVLADQVFINAQQKDSTIAIRLIGTTQHGCKDTSSNILTIYPNPESQFTASPTTSCAPFIINSSSILLTEFPLSNDAYTWRVLSGDKSSVLNSTLGTVPPSYTISTSGDSVVYQLITTNIHGCKADTMEIMFRTIANPVAAFSMSDSVGCSVLNVTFTNLSSPGVALDWRFSNGQTSASQTPSVSFSNASNTLDAIYFAKLVITAGGTGCRDSITDTIRVFPNPKSIFGITQPNLCPLSTVALTNGSVFKNPSVIYRWRILNSDTVKLSDSTVATPNVIIPDNQSNTDSTFSIRLRSISVDGCIHDTVGNFTRLRRPLVQFTIPSDACGPFTFVPVNTTGNIPAAELSWLWTVTPNTSVAIVSTNSQSPSITLPENITADSLNYTVKLTATRSALGCIDTLSQIITVYPKPVVAFTSSLDTGCTPLNVSFANTTDPRNNELRNSMGFVWSLNNTAVSSDSVLSPQAFVNPLQHDSVLGIRLIGTTQHGCMDTADKSLVIHPDAKASYSFVRNVSCAPFTIDNTIITSQLYTEANSGYEWYINDSLIGVNPVFPGYTIINADDSVYIKLKTISLAGCRDDSMIVLFKTIPNPKPDFNFTDSIGCTPFQFSVNNTSTPATDLTYEWLAGTQTSTQKNPTFSAANYGVADTVVNVKLVVIAGGTGCRDSIEKSVIVKPLPNPDFTIVTATHCFPQPLQVQNTSAAPPLLSNTGYKWSTSGPGITTIVNDTASGLAEITIPDNQSGVSRDYIVKLIATSTFGCIDSISKSVNTPTRPVANFIFNKDSGCSYETIITDNSSLYGNQYRWVKLSESLGIAQPDDFNTSVTTPPHSGNIDSVYYLKLITTNTAGCSDSIIKPLIALPKPVAAFSVDTNTGCAPLTVQFTNGTIAMLPVQYLWRLEATISDTNTDLSHTFSGSAFHDTTYLVSMIATSRGGCLDTTSQPVTVKASAVAHIQTADSIYCMNGLNQGIVAISNLSYGDVDTFYYDFGDMTTLVTTSNAAIVHTYLNEGTYKIKLTAKNSCKTSRDSVTVKILKAPQPLFSLSDSLGCSPLVVKFQNNTPNYEATYFWDFGNGLTSAAKHPDSVIYYQSKLSDTTYIVKLTVANFCGIRFSQDTVRVLPLPITSFLISTDSGCSPLTVSFLNTTTGLPSFVKWYFGNGDSSTRYNPFPQTYRTEDTVTIYTIRLVASNICGVDTASKSIIVQPNTVRAFFTTTGTTGCAPFTVKFFDRSVGGNNVTWDLGGGNTSTLQNPEITYLNPGTYKVMQYVNNGCSYDTASVIVKVLKTPIFGISKSKSVACVGESISFFSTIVDSGAITWYFGDGDSSTFYNPVHQYQTGGKKIIRVVLRSNINGCPSVRVDSVNINPLPVVEINTDTNQACTYKTFEFSTGASTGLYHTWTMGDNTTYTGTSVSHTYGLPGSYTVRLTAENVFGCIDSVTRLITVFPKPDAGFSYTPKDTCAGPVVVKFTNLSVGATSYLWTFGNGLNTTITNPSITYASVGNYDISLVAGNQYNCFDTATAVYHIFHVPIPSFTFTALNGCEPLTVQFTNTSIFGDSLFWDFGDGTNSVSLNPVHIYTQPGIFDVKLTVVAGGMCADTITETKAIEVYPKPDANFTWQLDSSVRPYSIIQFTNLSLGSTHYLWNFGDGITSEEIDPRHRYVSADYYTASLIAISDKGCMDTVAYEIWVPKYTKGLFVPNAFTPGYGQPEVQEFKPVGIELRNYHLKIYNKWGELIWETKELTEKGEPKVGWNGLDKNGIECFQGAYVWSIEAVFTDGLPWPGMIYPTGSQKPVTSGNVTLIR